MEHSKEYLDWLARQFDEQLTEKDKAFLALVGIGPYLGGSYLNA